MVLREAAALFAVFVYVAVVGFGTHQVSEGHVGVYFRGGALLPDISNPGWNVKIPFFTTFAEVQVTVQTDSVENIPCGTSGGVLIQFDKVEVVNRLRKEFVYETIKNYTTNYDKTWIFDKIHHEINQFCSRHSLTEVYITKFDSLDEHLAIAIQKDCDKWAPGIEVISVRVTKPRIPETIRRNFEAMEAEKTKLLIAEQAQKVAEKEAETERKKKTIQAESESDVSKIRSEKEVAENAAQQRIRKIQDEMHLAHEKAVADAIFYQTSRQADANAALLTPEYLYYMNILSLGNITKIYFGEKIPHALVELPVDLFKSSSGAATPSRNTQKISKPVGVDGEWDTKNFS